jgi:uncharacterized protein with PIN domain
MEKHLKPYQYYLDLYDKFTVEHCRRIEKIDFEIELPKYKGEEISSERQTPIKKAFSELHLYFETGEEYAKKSETISRWMERDKKYDESYKQAQAPENITCLTCGRIMFVISKHLDFANSKNHDRVMFFYDCPLNHKPMRVFYDDGEEYRVKQHVCIKCNSSVSEKTRKENKDKIAITYECKECGNIEHTDIDLSHKEEKLDLDFTKDRDRFCLSEKDGQKYLAFKINMNGLAEMMDKYKEREKNKDLYDKVEKLKKLKIIELEELLAPILEKAQYIKFHFKEPEVTKDVIIPFVTHDAKADRTDRESTLNLSKIIRKALENTNWRLMSEEINYRLGMLEGRLRAYEREEDLINLVSK